jgi:hypothetical protein
MLLCAKTGCSGSRPLNTMYRSGRGLRICLSGSSHSEPIARHSRI